VRFWYIVRCKWEYLVKKILCVNAIHFKPSSWQYLLSSTNKFVKFKFNVKNCHRDIYKTWFFYPFHFIYDSSVTVTLFQRTVNTIQFIWIIIDLQFYLYIPPLYARYKISFKFWQTIQRLLYVRTIMSVQFSYIYDKAYLITSKLNKVIYYRVIV
jgi:hypothetical protein